MQDLLGIRGDENLLSPKVQSVDPTLSALPNVIKNRMYTHDNGHQH
jgi:hypothetical protein